MHIKKGFSRDTKTTYVIICVNRAYELYKYCIKTYSLPLLNHHFTRYTSKRIWDCMGGLKMIYKLMWDICFLFFFTLIFFYYLCISLIKVQNIFMSNPCKQIAHLNMPLKVSLSILYLLTSIKKSYLFYYWPIRNYILIHCH